MKKAFYNRLASAEPHLYGWNKIFFETRARPRNSCGGRSCCVVPVRSPWCAFASEVRRGSLRRLRCSWRGALLCLRWWCFRAVLLLRLACVLCLWLSLPFVCSWRWSGRFSAVCRCVLRSVGRCLLPGVRCVPCPGCGLLGRVACFGRSRVGFRCVRPACPWRAWSGSSLSSGLCFLLCRSVRSG